jgi:hypothetical protein
MIMRWLEGHYKTLIGFFTPSVFSEFVVNRFVRAENFYHQKIAMENLFV